MSLPRWDNGTTRWDDGSRWDFGNTRPTYPAVTPVAGATIVPFTPSATSNFTFQVTLDGQSYTAIVTWGLFGQRYYISLFTSTGTRLVTLPLIGSPNDYNISLTAGYTTTKLVFRQASQVFEIFG